MIKAVIFDFYGVLSHDKFYGEAFAQKHQELYKWIQNNIFADEEILYKWMRNEINSDNINKIIAQGTGHQENFLCEVLNESLRNIKLDDKMLGLAKKLKTEHGKKIGLVTDNMDGFSSLVARQHDLHGLFDTVVNSADHGYLKAEREGELFDKALDILNEEIESCVFIDDSLENVEMFKRKGGQGFLYVNNFEELNNFLNNNL